MQYCFKKIFFLAIFNIFLIITVSTVSADLIEPTRNFGDDSEAMGKLTVLSEPPGLKVTLDGNGIGKTPRFLLETEPGAHTLRVGKQETGIYIAPGETLQISLFKNEFVLIPVRDETEETQVETAVQKAPESPEPDRQAPHEQRANEERRRAKERFMRFLDGSSPAF